MRRQSILIISICLLISAPSFVLAEEAAPKWKRVKNKNNVQVFRAHNEETKLKSFKAVTRLELDNIQSFLAIFLDGEGYKNWMHMIRFSEVSGADSPEPFEWFAEFRLPWPVKDRRIKTGYVITQSDDYSIRMDLVPPKTPAVLGKKYIVVPESSGFFALKTFPDSKEIEITAEVFVDPGGFIPAFLVNLITDDISYFSAKKLRRYIVLDKYQNYETDLVKRRPWVWQRVE